MSISNAPLPDQLNAIREQIKALQEQEAAIRSELLAHPELRTGASWIAEVRTVPQQRTDIKELKAMHPEIAAEYTFSVPITRIELSGVDEHGEIIPARKFRAAQETAQ